jgi:hypothetical protein
VNTVHVLSSDRLDLTRYETAKGYAIKNNVKLATVIYRCNHNLYAALKIRSKWYVLKDQDGYAV